MKDNREKLLQSIAEALQELNTDALQFIDSSFIPTMKASERNSINTTEERLAEIKTSDTARDKAFEASKKEAEEFNSVFVYNRNETMKLIGKSHYNKFVIPGGKYSSGFDDIAQAHKYDHYTKSPFDIGLDFFIYGMICGVKEQRAK